MTIQTAEQKQFSDLLSIVLLNTEYKQQRRFKTMRPETRTCYMKNGKNWTVTYIETDTTAIYKALNQDLRYRFIHRSAYIKRLTDRSNYDGTRTITVYYNNDVKSVYIVKD